MPPSFPHLFTPLQPRHQTLRNRIVFGAHTANKPTWSASCAARSPTRTWPTRHAPARRIGCAAASRATRCAGAGARATTGTYWKTAADSALGADLLARPDARTLLMVGAGALAPHLIRAYQAIRPALQQVLVWNRTPAKAQATAAAVVGTPAAPAPDLEAAVRAADIVCCATSSREPLVQGAWLHPGTHLDLIGGFTPEMREADDAAVRCARVFVDSRWFTVEHVGDLTQAIASGVITRADVLGDLFDLCSGHIAGRTDANQITLFKSGGAAHLDLMTAQHIAGRIG